MIDTARRTVTELGLRNALLEVEHFAGIVELVVDDPAAAEPHLRLAYNGFRRMGLDADAAETAALLSRACLLLDRAGEADELCTESARLAGHALKASITWRTVRAQLLARDGDHDEAQRIAEEAVAIAGRTDALVDHGDACLALATVLDAAGDTAGARAAAEQAEDLYEQKGAVALAEKAHRTLGDAGARAVRHLDGEEGHPPATGLDNIATHVYRDIIANYHARDWHSIRRLLAKDIATDDRRRTVNAGRRQGRDAVIAEILAIAEVGVTETWSDVIATRGRYLVLCRSRAAAGRQFESLHTDLLEIIEVNSDNLVSARLVFLYRHALYSTWTTSMLLSQNSMPDTSPAKRPSILIFGRQSQRPLQR